MLAHLLLYLALDGFAVNTRQRGGIEFDLMRFDSIGEDVVGKLSSFGLTSACGSGRVLELSRDIWLIRCRYLAPKRRLKLWVLLLQLAAYRTVLDLGRLSK